MAGQIIPRGRNNWLVRVYLGESQGKRRYLNRTVKGPKRDAQTVLTRLLREKDTQTLVETTRETVADFLHRWLREVASIRVGARTAQDYRQYTERYLLPVLGDHRLSQLTSINVQSLYAAMLARELSPRTVRFAHAILRMALAHAVKTGQLARNAADYVTLPKQTRREMKSLSADEARRFLIAAAAEPSGPFFTLLLMVGLRPGEAAGLKWSDLEGNQLRIQRSLTPGYRGTWSTHEPKTARSRRTVVLPETVVRALAVHKRRQAAEKLAAGRSYQAQDFIFANTDGSPVHPATLSKKPFARVLRAAGLPAMRLYDLRHASASLALASGEHVKQVSERLGHSSALLTLDTYSHVLPGMQHDSARRMDELLAVGL
jgi:integrase